MDITYYNHSCFKIKGKAGTVVTDPYDAETGPTLPSISADIVTSSHDHHDHNAVEKVAGTARRAKPFVISYPGEYEVGGISVFGYPSFHDEKEGAERGNNTIYVIFIDELRVCHLGDLGHELTSEQLDQIGTVDILLCPVGGKYTIDGKTATKVIQQLEPAIIIPMHYRTDKHGKGFDEVNTLADFLKEYGVSPAPQTKLSIEKSRLPEEETQLVILEPEK
jgi:L-ascorbate metabolism protein UlaG (beta-lactamase superfamily)